MDWIMEAKDCMTWTDFLHKIWIIINKKSQKEVLSAHLFFFFIVLIVIRLFFFFIFFFAISLQLLFQQ